ncbi:MAG: permease-like cell division protein FtsX [Candidatus Moranbacteria bacterium]|jgi:cell division transport system permease protein|nr:permease-like cell division protein FtsX [Candidatus Moranbacteria bacterium]NCA93576.1 ABC transporter permease [Sphingobacteriia bacterium]
MKFLKLKRVIAEGWTSFKRNAWLTVATVLVLSLSLFIIGSTLFVGLSAGELLKRIEQNVNISVYFKNNVEEARILEIKAGIEQRPEIALVQYINKETALEKFSKENDGDEVISEALKEIGENPLFSSLVLTAKDQSYYEELSNYVEKNFEQEVDRINYGRNKIVIEKLGRIISTMEKIGLGLGGIFILISVLVTFSTIRMSLYSRKKEFDIMRLVGASNLYIKIPTIVEGMIYGLLSALVAMVFIAAITYGGIPVAGGIIPKEEMIGFYVQNIWKVGLVVLISGLAIGVLSSLISIRKYLKI